MPRGKNGTTQPYTVLGAWRAVLTVYRGSARGRNGIATTSTIALPLGAVAKESCNPENFPEKEIVWESSDGTAASFVRGSGKNGGQRNDAVIPLGAFERVPLREAWPTEDGNFTPWLAQDDTMKLLGEALNLELEVEAVEHWVGPFRADILARVADDASEVDHRVIIENQFGRTNHGHLGQILTYLAGIEHAKTVVWIAEIIQADHRAAVDWLNANTTEDFSFFAIEIELWRIGDSPPAPRFNIIASPNDWTKTARKASIQVGEPGLAERHRVQIPYWASFAEYLKQKGSTFRIRPSRKGNVVGFAIGRSGARIVAIISTEQRRIGVALYLNKDADKTEFRALYAQKEEIEKEIGESLDWTELPGQKRSRINLYKDQENPADESNREQQYAWLLAGMERFRAVFVPRLRLLPLHPGGDPGETEDLSEEE
jgi:hypothetical protein